MYAALGFPPIIHSVRMNRNARVVTSIVELDKHPGDKQYLPVHIFIYPVYHCTSITNFIIHNNY